DFPTTVGALQTAQAGAGYQAFVSKFDTALSGSGSLLYSTYLGASGGDTKAYAVAVDPAGNACVTGQVDSAAFPTTPSAYQATIKATHGGHNGFITKLNPSGSAAVYSTYLGGSTNDLGRAIAVDNAGSAYVAGWSSSLDFPTVNPIQASDNSPAG